ncbi:MAG: peptide-methionine (S)-S-oxide reductase MsrA [Acidobacteriaceae bacterium]|nr:peptide-methionine (S)-S-oxide reductase MsrA [Acidobacteriaceae bacterium]
MRRLFTTLFAATLALSTVACNAQLTHSPLPAPKQDDALAAKPSRATAVFAGGCFWGTQAVFEHVKGVLKVTAGYAGGSASTATYSQVTTETTKHAESVEIVYDPSKLTFGQLLRVFFTVHDPTTLNRQGNDEGTSYRSAVFYTSPQQFKLAQAYIEQLSAARSWPNKIVTEVTPLKGFYPGEDYHQDYALKNPNDPYILVCDRPKIATLKADYPELYVTYKGH